MYPHEIDTFDEKKSLSEFVVYKLELQFDLKIKVLRI